MTSLWILQENMVLWKYKMTQWTGISLNWITDWFCTYMCIHAKHFFFLCCIQRVYKTNWIIAEHVLMKTRERSKFLKELRTFHDLFFNIRNKIYLRFLNKRYQKLTGTADFLNRLLVETCSLSFHSN